MSVSTISVDYAASRSQPVDWAMEELRRVLASRGLTGTGDAVPALRVLVCDCDDVRSRPLIARWREMYGDDLTETPEAFAVRMDTDSTVVACGADARGLSYAVLEIAELSGTTKIR